MAITLSSTKITTATVNTSVSANFAGPVDFSSAVISGEADKWQIVSADSNLSVNRNYFANTTGTGDATGIAMTLTLPSSANVGDTITVIDQTANAQSNNVVIARNGNPIDGANRNVILNVQRGGVRLVYTGFGWTTKKVERDRSVLFQGTVSGYTMGGYNSGDRNEIDKFSFVSDADATDVGNLTQGRRAASGQTSTTHGYTSGGLDGPPTTWRDIVDRFSFASDTNATDAGDLSVERRNTSGQSSATSGYVSGGENGTPGTPRVDTIDKFPFATGAFGTATDIGNLQETKNGLSGQSSKTDGYASGGSNGTILLNVIDKFPFASDTNATDAGNLSQSREQTAGVSSENNGYVCGGGTPSQVNTIDKFPFASDFTTASDVGDLVITTNGCCGTSSFTNGYVSGGYDGTPPGPEDEISKFPFASDTNATDVGNLSVARSSTSSTGAQV